MTAPDWPPEDVEALKRAKPLLESPGLLIRLTDKLGLPVDYMLKQLPPAASNLVQQAARTAVSKTLDAALFTLGRTGGKPPNNLFHKIAVIATGGGGGAFGLPALPFELPLTTGIMMRSIAETARSEGEDLGDLETKLACLQVFALGGTGKSDNAAESGYFAVRAMLAKAVSEAVEYIAEKGIAETGAPILVRLVAQIASRFGVQVTEKVAAQAIPVIGALGGASVNLVFMDHFQKTAQGHFTIRRLERRFGMAAVQGMYRGL